MYHLPKNILIADSGATKADWCLLVNGVETRSFRSPGFSPIYQTAQEIETNLQTHVLPQLNGLMAHTIHFYGTGCIPEKIPIIENVFRRIFPQADIAAHSDLLAAAHALCQRQLGIACILGTGSNSCQWNGQRIVKQVSPLGFILGDEGSGASLGKMLLGDALKNRLTAGLKEKLLDQYQLTPALIIDRVYRQPFPNRFLASLAPFIKEHIGDESIAQIVHRAFTDFLERNVSQYQNYQHTPVHFTGSVAWHFAPQLQAIASQANITTGRILQSPMTGLIDYYRTVASQQ